MKTITTIQTEATETKGSVIKATSEDGDSTTFPFADGCNLEFAHGAAARKLAAMLGWDGELKGEWVEGSMVWTLGDGKGERK